MSYGYGGTIRQALRRHNLTVQRAAEVMGYAGPSMMYKILSDEAEPTLDKLQRLATHVNEPVGDLLPNSGANPITDELRDILAAISGIAGDDRDQTIAALAVNARVIANAYRRQPGVVSRATVSAPSAFKDSQFVTEENRGYTPSPSEETLGAALLGEGRVRDEGEQDVPVGDRPAVRNRAGKRR